MPLSPYYNSYLHGPRRTQNVGGQQPRLTPEMMMMIQAQQQQQQRGTSPIGSLLTNAAAKKVLEKVWDSYMGGELGGTAATEASQAAWNQAAGEASQAAWNQAATEAASEAALNQSLAEGTTGLSSASAGS